MKDYQDIKRVLDQLISDNPDFFEQWLEQEYCCNCVDHYSAKLLEEKPL